MQLRVLGPNQTEIEADGAVVFFSYNTPVAAQINGELFVTAQKYSTTTSKHIAGWRASREAAVKPQSWFNDFFTVTHSDGITTVPVKGGAK